MDKELKSELERLGADIKIHLNMQYAQWKTGLPFKTIFTKYSTRAKRLGLEVSIMSNHLAELGFIKIAITPTGKRWVFSTDAGLSDEQISEIVQSEEQKLEIEKEIKRMKA